MIAYLEGEVHFTAESLVILVVNGVGYKVTVPQSLISSLHVSKGKKLSLYIYSHIREDSHELYGVSTHKDLELFEKIVSISGIGPKIALGIFNKGSRDAIVSAILSSDVAFFSGIPRLGKKNAQKIIIELKSKLGGEALDEIPDSSDENTNHVLLALKSFGFTRKEAIEALKGVSGSDLSVEEKIKQALKFLGK